MCSRGPRDSKVCYNICTSHQCSIENISSVCYRRLSGWQFTTFFSFIFQALCFCHVILRFWSSSLYLYLYMKKNVCVKMIKSEPIQKQNVYEIETKRTKTEWTRRKILKWDNERNREPKVQKGSSFGSVKAMSTNGSYFFFESVEFWTNTVDASLIHHRILWRIVKISNENFRLWRRNVFNRCCP